MSGWRKHATRMRTCMACARLSAYTYIHIRTYLYIRIMYTWSSQHKLTTSCVGQNRFAEGVSMYTAPTVCMLCVCVCMDKRWKCVFSNQECPRAYHGLYVWLCMLCIRVIMYIFVCKERHISVYTSCASVLRYAFRYETHELSHACIHINVLGYAYSRLCLHGDWHKACWYAHAKACVSCCVSLRPFKLLVKALNARKA